jgi:hypothetical protein
VTVTGRVFDGRFLESESGGEARGIGATLKVFECPLSAHGPAPGATRRSQLLAKTKAVRTGDFLLSVVPSRPRGALYVEASRAGFLPVGCTVQVNGGRSEVKLYLAPTAITGTVLGPDGKPAVTDIWVLREEQPGKFMPHEITGGRTLRLAFGAHHTRFGTDSDVAGHFHIPIRRAHARFQLIVAVDTNTDKFETRTTDPFFVKTDELIILKAIRLQAPRSPSPDSGPGPGTGPVSRNDSSVHTCIRVSKPASRVGPGGGSQPVECGVLSSGPHLICTSASPSQLRPLP